MPNSIVAQLAERQRQAILNREEAVMKEMAIQWKKIEDALEANLLKLVAELQAQGVTGADAIMRTKRWSDLMYQARAQYARFANYFDERVAALQEQNFTAGIDAGYEMLSAAMEEAGIQIAFDKLPVDAIESMVGFSADGSPLRTLLNDSYGSAVNGILDNLVTSLAKGTGVVETARSMLDGFSKELDRALLIARTEQMRAYRLGSLEQYRSAGVPMQYKRLAKKDDRTCIGCLFQDGVTYETADEFAEHPNGRCVIVPVPPGSNPTWTTGTEWFEGLSEERQRRILGEQRFELWQSGTPLKDFSTLKPNAVWGGSFVPTPLKVLTK